jgi:hypothetical protein
VNHGISIAQSVALYLILIVQEQISLPITFTRFDRILSAYQFTEKLLLEYLVLRAFGNSKVKKAAKSE